VFRICPGFRETTTPGFLRFATFAAKARFSAISVSSIWQPGDLSRAESTNLGEICTGIGEFEGHLPPKLTQPGNFCRAFRPSSVILTVR